MIEYCVVARCRDNLGKTITVIRTEESDDASFAKRCVADDLARDGLEVISISASRMSGGNNE
jgi:hypothetical protein